MCKVGTHEPKYTLHTIVNITIGPCLFAISPDFNFFPVPGESDFPANCGRGLLASAVIGSKRAENVVESHYARVEAEILRVMSADALHVQFLPPVSILRV